MKCYKNVFTIKYLQKNYRFFTFILVYIIYFIFLFLFYLKYFNNLKNEIKIIISAKIILPDKEKPKKRRKKFYIIRIKLKEEI